jgi:hypothetical protein
VNEMTTKKIKWCTPEAPRQTAEQEREGRRERSNESDLFVVSGRTSIKPETMNAFGRIHCETMRLKNKDR